MATEKRLIDANEYKMALEKMREDACATHDWGYEAILDDCIWELDAQTTVDAVEVVHGRWIKNWCNNSFIGHEYAECSICDCHMLDTNQFWNSNYCPNCGAKMDGGVDNGG